MIVVKKQNPEFYDCRCDKCRAEFLYQLEDVVEEPVEGIENENPIFSIMLPKVYRYVICPCCKNKISTSFFTPNMGLGFAGN